MIYNECVIMPTSCERLKRSCNINVHSVSDGGNPDCIEWKETKERLGCSMGNGYLYGKWVHTVMSEGSGMMHLDIMLRLAPIEAQYMSIISRIFYRKHKLRCGKVRKVNHAMLNWRIGGHPYPMFNL